LLERRNASETEALMIRGSIRSLVVAVSLLSVSCGPSNPAGVEPAFADVTFLYTSILPVGDADPAEAGFCAHHALGMSRLELWKDGQTLLDTLFMRTSGVPPRAVVTAERVPVDTALVAVVWDLQCCSHTGPCSPTEELSANSVRLTRVVRLSVDGRTGLAFRVRGSGVIVQ
jgi:hypothetical protein